LHSSGADDHLGLESRLVDREGYPERRSTAWAEWQILGGSACIKRDESGCDEAKDQ
jgi:hypothetical protein